MSCATSRAPLWPPCAFPAPETGQPAGHPVCLKVGRATLTRPRLPLPLTSPPPPPFCCCSYLLAGCPHHVLAILQASTILVMAFGSRLPQILLNVKRGNSGMLSVTSCALNVAGNLVSHSSRGRQGAQHCMPARLPDRTALPAAPQLGAAACLALPRGRALTAAAGRTAPRHPGRPQVRIFTSIVLTGDMLLLSSSLTQGCFNMVLLVQSVQTERMRRSGLLAVAGPAPA